MVEDEPERLLALAREVAGRARVGEQVEAFVTRGRTTSTPGVSMGTRIWDCRLCLGASGSVTTIVIMILQRASPAPEI